MRSSPANALRPPPARGTWPAAVYVFSMLLCLTLVACGAAPTATPVPTPPAGTALVARPGVRGATDTPARPVLAAAVTATPVTPTTPFTYTVQAGDTLGAIAARYGVRAADIAAANGLADPDTLAIGQELVIPAGTLAASSTDAAPEAAEAPVGPPLLPRPTEPFMYDVQPGDTLLALSARYGVGVADLMAANGLSRPEELRSGVDLLIPVGGLTAPAGGQTFAYQVAAGDTLFAIAMRYDITVADLMAANRLASPDALVIGQELRIPTGAPPPAQAPPATPTASALSTATALPPATPGPTVTPIPTVPPASGEQYRAWMEEARLLHPFAESVDLMWAVMMCESGGNAGQVGNGTYYGLFQYRLSTWSGGWNPYRDSSIFDPHAQIFATAKAWLDGHQSWWRGCWPQQ